MTDFTVMITGESGVGKEVLAKFLHINSHRSKGNFIKVNCGAIPENLIESELFGYERGAFTGASVEGKPGLFEIAHGGTIFLDEIGELPYNMQVKLLRVLQEGEFTRVGGVMPRKADVRVVAATHRNLEEMVNERLFREDLYYRLNVIPILVPPLRERPADILALIRYFLEGINAKYHWQKRFGRDALDALHDYHWPGNIRELKNVVERVVAMSRDDIIACDDLPNKIVAQNRESVMRYLTDIVPLEEAVAGVEEALLTKAFEKYGNVRAAAKALGIDASTFVRKRQRIRKYREASAGDKVENQRI
jgi:transcriptional regulator with PAS, ATPase and Fis domain